VRERVAADGLPLPEALQFLDNGYRGATLVRPALERLRDLAAAGTVDRRYGHSPDRLARPYADQVLLVDAFQHAGVEVIVLNRELDRSPEDDVRLHVQGLMASMCVPRVSNAIGVASAMRPEPAPSMCSAERPMATATAPSLRGVARLTRR
jgi:hypothetical protein